jgi:cytochrome b subunit of formate dehydrogenase
VKKVTVRKVTITVGLLIIIAIFSGISANAANVGEVLGNVMRPAWEFEAQNLNAAKSLFAQALLVVIVLGIMGGFILGRSSRKKPMVPFIANGKVKRHTVSILFEHWTHTVGVIICIITAVFLLLGTRFGLLVFFSPFLLAYKLHFIGAGILVFASLFYIVNHIIAGDREILPVMSDVKDSIAETMAIMGIIGDGTFFGIRGLYLPKIIKKPLANLLAKIGVTEPPHAEKWLPIERVETPVWGVLVGLIILTGVVKTIRYVIDIPPTIAYVATIIHDIVAILVILLLIVHIITAAIIPPSWPLFKSMLTTKTSEEYVKGHHPEWYKKLRKE